MKADDLFAVGVSNVAQPVTREVKWTKDDGEEISFTVKVLPRNAGSILRAQQLNAGGVDRPALLTYLCTHVLIGEDEQRIPYEKAENMKATFIAAIIKVVEAVHVEQSKAAGEPAEGN